MSQANRLGDLAISDTGFVFDPRSGSTFTVNATGLSVLSALKEGLDVAGVEERLRERFDAASADVARDVDDFVAMLRQYGILSQASAEEQGR
jgi:PqqD family protein of HPr-rel-A system